MNETTNFGFSNIVQGLKIIYRHSKAYKKSFVFIFSLIVISSVVDGVSPFLWGKVIDTINAESTVTLYGHVVLLAYALLFIYFILLVIQAFADLQKSLSARLVEENLRLTYVTSSYAHVFRLPLSFHKSVKQGETTEKIRNAAQAINSIISDSILESIPDLLTAFIMFIFVLFTNKYMGGVVGIALCGYIFYSLREISPTGKLQRESQKAYRKANGLIQDALTNIRSIKDFNTEQYEESRINKTYTDEALPAWYKAFRIRRRTGAVQNRIRIGVRAAVLIISIYMISRGDLTIGQMIAYNSYAMMIFSPLSSIINRFRSVQDGIVAIEQAESLLAVPQESYIPASAKNIKSIEGEINFSNVDFQYEDGKQVLNNINFNASPGETVALVGESGVGKSTLIDLLMGYHFASGGQVLIDGINLKNIDLNFLRRQIAVVSQEISLFNDSIKNNLAYGSFERSFDKIKEAARKAHCIEFIDKFPEKWDQIVGEKGLKLSVGQKQRVAIARAILKDPKILILDEPTSALDAGSEKIITESFQDLMKGRTTFIIAHRLSTVRRADKILVFKNGTIVEQGTHSELMLINKGEYRKLYELQIGLHE